MGWIWRPRPAILAMCRWRTRRGRRNNDKQERAQGLDEQQRAHAHEAWSDHESRQIFEHQLIDRKTTWLLTTQTILFAAYGVTFRGGAAAGDVRDFRTVVSWVGIAIAAAVFIGVLALINSKRIAWKDYQKYFEDPRASSIEARVALPEPVKAPLQWGVRTPNTCITLLPDLVLPIVFILAWAFL